MLRLWRQAARSLVRKPAFTAAAIVILAAGIGATTGVFAIVDDTVLKPLPYPDADQLVLVLEASSAKTDAAGLVAPARLADWNRLSHTFDVISGSYGENVTESSGDEPERLAARRVAPRYFDVFGTRPALGRAFTADEETAGGPAAIVISDRLWARRFQRRRDVLERRLSFGGRSYAIVGVMPPSFDDPRVELWVPTQLSSFLMQARDARFITGVGRMKAGVSRETAQRDLAAVQTTLAAEYPATDKDWSARVTDLKTSRVGQYREPLFFVLGSVVLLLLIALGNTASLMLGQLQRRAGEFAVRGALGASRGQIVSGVMREVALLLVIATALALTADLVVLRAAGSAVASLPRANGLGIDARAAAISVAAAAVAALICGVLPVWRATRPDRAATLVRAARGGSRDGPAQDVVLASQIALATLLLAGTSLMLRSYYNLARVDAGVDGAHAVTFHVGAAWDEDRVAVAQMQQQLLAALAALPGVTAAGFSNFLPASNATLRYQVRLLGAAESDAASDQLTVGERGVTRDYFAAIGARVAAGSSCPAPGAVASSPPKALVNRRFVTTLAGGRSVVGRYVSGISGQPGAPMEIVGVVDDIREDNLRTAAVPYLYVCLAPGNWPDPEYVVRTTGAPQALVSSIRATVRAVAPGRAIFGAMPFQEYLDATLGETRLQTVVVSAFGAAAVLLAMIGLYGLVTLGVASRRREIGIRIALGAEPGRVIRDVSARVARLAVAGTVVGLGFTALAGRQLRAVVFGVGAFDAATIGVAVGCLAVAAAVATLVPAFRATRIDPVTAMRES